jgi:hypothetical protein
MRAFSSVILAIVALVVSTGCARSGGGGGGRGRDGTGACDPLASACAEDLVCDALVSGEARCVTPLLIRGLVLDALDDSPIEGALVQAVDANGAAVGTSGATSARLSRSTPTQPPRRSPAG